MARPRKLIVTDIDSTISRARRRLELVLQKLGRTDLIAQKQRYRGWIQEHLEGRERERFLELFLSDRYLELDEPLPGAAETLQQLKQAGLMIVYLTGRHDAPGDSMRRGTEQWLAEHGFPVPDGANVRLVMKPQRGWDDQEFKSRALDEISGWGQALAGIGDRPEDAQAYARHGIRPILLLNELYREEQLRQAADGVQVVRDWGELRELLLELVGPRAIREG